MTWKHYESVTPEQAVRRNKATIDKVREIVRAFEKKYGVLTRSGYGIRPDTKV